MGIEEIHEESAEEETKHILPKKAALGYQIFYVLNDKDQNVIVEETPQINFRDVMRHLEDGESVFIKQIDRK